MNDSNISMGRLEQVELRDAWENEAQHFTPWLAKAENLDLLAETIDIELELEAEEESVGPFRADILCKDVNSGDWVLIENQLERTDHKHLGQLMTYAAGLKAATIVWIAEKFTDEHRAAIDWLNEITDEGFRFFALEVELWRIGNSPVAPKFNVVSSPNEWTKHMTGAINTHESDRYLAAFWNFVRREKPDLSMSGLGNEIYVRFPMANGDFETRARLNRQQNLVEVRLAIKGSNKESRHKALMSHADTLTSLIGNELEFGGTKTTVRAVRLLKKVDLPNESDWPQQHAWLLENVQKFLEVFPPIIQAIVAEESAGKGE